MCAELLCCCFFFFKQKTAYEMRISDWSSDVCSSDLIDSDKWARRVVALRGVAPDLLAPENAAQDFRDQQERVAQEAQMVAEGAEIGRAPCRERVCQYV